MLLEAGTASGREPIVTVELRSYLSEYLSAQGISMNAADEQPFAMRLLHFRRTFVEKMFAIHSKVEILKRDRTPIGTYARHYYDLAQLATQSDVLAMLKSEEYAAIKADYDAISRTHFPNSYFWPADMKFANSEALFPPDALAATLAAEYESQCRQLCYGPYPSWVQLQETFADLRKLL